MTRLKPTGSQHLFTPDATLPPDQNGRQVCSTCHLVGRPGDAHHTLPVMSERDAQERAAGERGEG